MCEKILQRVPSMTAEEREQLRRNCRRALLRSGDRLLAKEAVRILSLLNELEEREASVLARLPAARRIEYAFRRLPASDGERRAIRLLHEHSGAEVGRLDEAWGEDGGPWLRQVGAMCRDRRHLLVLPAAAGPAMAPTTAHDEPDWTGCLVEVDEDEGIVRMRPEAATAFASLGYVGQPS